MGYKHTYDTIYTHFQGTYNNIYGFGRLFCSFIIYPSTTHPPIFLPIRIRFYPSKVGGSLHKAMVNNNMGVSDGSIERLTWAVLAKVTAW